MLPNFFLPFYLLPIEGDHPLGPINTDFSIPSITFQHNDAAITLKGDPKSNPTQPNPDHLPPTLSTFTN